MKARFISGTSSLTIILIASIFALDLATPLGWVEWLLYVLPLLLAFRVAGGRHLYPIATACTILIGVAYLFDTPQYISTEIALFNRSLGVFVLWMTAFLLAQSVRGEEAHIRLAAIVESSNDAIIGKTLDGIVVSWNAAAEHMFGYTQEDVIGKGVAFLFPPDRINEETQLLERIRQGERIDHFETVRRRKDGSAIHVSLTVSPIVDAKGTIIGVSKIARDITQRKRSEEENAWLFEQVEESRERLRALSRRLLEVQESERASLARELHDEIGQALTAMKINLQTALRHFDPIRISSRLNDCVALVDDMLLRVRARSLDLHPPLLDELGLAPALKWYIAAQAQRAGLSVDLAIDSPNSRFPADLEIACFRVVQEALTNVIRHAQAKRVNVDIREKNGRLNLSIRDDGLGFDLQTVMQKDTTKLHVGLLGMHERIRILRGQIAINSAPQRGTEIQASIPLRPLQHPVDAPGVLIPS